MLDFAKDNMQSQTLALGCFGLWAVGSLIISAVLTVILTCFWRRHEHVDVVGLLAAFLSFPVLVLLRYIHIRPAGFFGLSQGFLLFLFVCFWSLPCSFVAWGTVQVLKRATFFHSLRGRLFVITGIPVTGRLLRRKGSLRKYSILALIASTYIMMSGPALLAYDTPVGPVVRMLYVPLSDGCRCLLFGEFIPKCLLRSETFSDTLRGPLAFFFGQTEG